MMKQTVLVAATIVILFLGWLLWKSDMTSVAPGKKLTIGRAELNVELATNLLAQVQGLSGRSSLCATCGMLFIFDQPKIQYFWMREMRFPLDIIFINRGRIVGWVPDVPVPQPGQAIPRVASEVPADMVLEVNAGFARAQVLVIGDSVTLR